MSQRCVAEIDALMCAALRPLLVQVPCLAARVSPAACPWRVRSRPCVPSPAVGVPGLGRATLLSAEPSSGLLCSALPCPALPCPALLLLALRCEAERNAVLCMCSC